ncbi:MAG: hypothetical protein BGO49_05250 [Planctomycetales bacterium 71-10]|nr:MAG: hypothetical protein BGO49_05250 [Planctomycetales bacterium 71-10]
MIQKLTRAAVLSLPLVFAAPARADLLRDWNVVVTGDAYVRTETEGPVRVGGNLYLAGGGYGISPRAGTLAGTGGVGLMVGGNVLNAQKDGVKLNPPEGGGVTSAVIGGSSTDLDRFANGPATVGVASVQGIGAADAPLLQSYSDGFKALTANNTYAIANGNQGLFKITDVDTVTGNAVFNVTAAEVFGNTGIGEIKLDLNGHTFDFGESIVINVSGSEVDWVGAKNFLDFGGALANVIWNFYGATEIDMHGYGNLMGAMLAPKATLLDTNTIDGGVFVKQIGDASNPYSGQGGEIHPPLYRGFVPTTTAVPEPSAFAMAGVALAAGAAFVRRTRRDA